MTVKYNIEQLQQVIEEARKLVEPSAEERCKVEEVTKYVLDILRSELPERGYPDCEVSVQGSIAKDTWLPENKDIDIFVIFPKERPREDLEKLVETVIDIANKYGIDWILKYAQHPYVQLRYEGFEIDVVPCYRIEPGEKPLTAADRTPLHTRYVMSKLVEKPQLKSDIRLLKRFLKRVGVYGAEIKVSGFSGYLAELLVVYYGSFIDLVRNVAESWRPRRVILDPEHHYQDYDMIKKMFKDHVLIVIDPVDPMRNAAAAVSLESMSTLIVACKLLLRFPNVKFFLPEEKKMLDSNIVEGRLVPPTVIIELPYPKHVVPDTMWGELKRLTRSLWNTLERYEFAPLDIRAWSDESSKIVIMISLRELDLPKYQLHEGPPAYRDEVVDFIQKYLQDPECVGPFIMKGRLYVIKRRKYDTIEKLLNAQLPQIAPKHLKKLVRQAKIYRIEAVRDLEKIEDETVRQELLKFLYKRPSWMDIVREVS